MDYLRTLAEATDKDDKALILALRQECSCPCHPGRYGDYHDSLPCTTCGGTGQEFVAGAAALAAMIDFCRKSHPEWLLTIGPRSFSIHTVKDLLVVSAGTNLEEALCKALKLE